MTRTDLYELADGDLLRPRAQHLTHHSEKELRQAILDGEPIWHLAIHYRTGLDSEQGFHRYFAARKAATSAEASYPIGCEIDLFEELRPKSSDFNADQLSVETLLSVMGRGEPPYFLVFEALQGAGVLGSDNRLSETVFNWIGQSGAAKLGEQFGENWEAVAALEYCAKHFHPTSLASLAARVQVGDFVAPCNYDAGYAARELQLSYSGAEKLALQSVETRKLAGKGGAEASRRQRSINLEALMQEIEKLAGAVDLFSEDRIVEQAFEAARSREPGMPKSKKTLEACGTALRSEESFRSRYEAVFRKIA